MTDRPSDPKYRKPRRDDEPTDARQQEPVDYGEESLPPDQQESPSQQQESPSQQQESPSQQQESPCDPQGKVCEDPEAELKRLKECQKEKQAALVQAEAELQKTQQERTGGEAILNQLDKLLKEVKASHEKYDNSYEETSEKVSEAFCTYKSIQNYCDCPEEALAEVDRVRRYVDTAIEETKQCIDEASGTYWAAAEEYEAASKDLKSAEDRLAKWISVDKQIAEYLKRLGDLAKKATEARCDCCVSYFYASEYYWLLKGKEGADCGNYLCYWVRTPEDLLAKLYELWCEVKDAKEAASDALNRRDWWKRKLDRLTADLKSLEESREQDILDAIAEIEECEVVIEECSGEVAQTAT